MIRQTEDEISRLEKEIDQYQYLLDHEDILNEALSKVTTSKNTGKE